MGRGGLGSQQGVAADEGALVELHDPAQTGFQGMDGVIDLVAVEGHLALQAEGVAAAQTRRQQTLRRASRHHGIPHLGGIGGGAVELKPVLAGVARAADEARHTGHLAVGEEVVADGLQRGLCEGLEDGQGAGALQGDLSGGGTLIHHGAVEGGGVGLDPGEVLVAVAGIDHQQELLVALPVHQEVIDKGAVFIEEGRVVDLPDDQLGDGVGREVLDQGQGPGALHPDLTHVTDIEQPGPGAHRLVLREDARRVLHRHVPAAEVDHLGVQGAMGCVEGGLHQLGHRGLQKPQSSPAPPRAEGQPAPSPGSRCRPDHTL